MMSTDTNQGKILKKEPDDVSEKNHGSCISDYLYFATKLNRQNNLKYTKEHSALQKPSMIESSHHHNFLVPFLKKKKTKKEEHLEKQKKKKEKRKESQMQKYDTSSA